MQRRPAFQLDSAKSHIGGCLASGTGQTFPRASVPCNSGGHQSFRSMLSRSSSQTRSVSALPLEQATQTGSPASSGAAHSEPGLLGREATFPVRDCAHEHPESAVEPHSPGGGCAGDVSSSEGTSTGSQPRAVLSRELPGRRAGIPLETVPELDPALVKYLNERFFAFEAGEVASKVFAAVAHERAGISKGTKKIPRAVQACRGGHLLSPAKSRLPLT